MFEKPKNIIKEMSAEMPPIKEFTRVKNQVYYQQGGCGVLLTPENPN